MEKEKLKNPTFIYQLKIVLPYIDPPVMRVFQIQGDASLGILHAAIQAVMGWKDYHLHEFIIKGKIYQSLDNRHEGLDMSNVNDELEYCLNDLLHQGNAFKYHYDFIDLWEHNILVEKIVNPKEGDNYPICIYGERACPPEDCGGPMGYKELLEVLKEPSHKKHKQYYEWVGKKFNSELFDIKETNNRLNIIKRNNKIPKDWV